MRLLSLCLLTTTLAAAQQELIVNGDFEAEGKGQEGPISGWKGGDRNHVELMNEGKNHFLRITVHEQATAMLCQRFEVKPSWGRIDVSVKLRAKGLVKGDKDYKTGMLQYVFRNASDEVVGGWTKRKADADQDWTTMTETVDVPQGATSFQVECWALECKGVFDFDDVSVKLTTR